MRTIYQVVVIFLLVLLATGCSNTDLSVQINESGSADITYRHTKLSAISDKQPIDFGIDKKVISGSSQSDLIQQAKAMGFAAEVLEGAQSGFIARKHLADFRNYLKSEQDLPYNFPKGFWQSSGIQYKEGIFHNTYSFKAQLNWAVLGISKPTESEQEQVSELVLEEPKVEQKNRDNVPVFTLKVSLPTKVDANNATLVGNNGRSLTWEISPGETDAVYFEAQDINYYSIVYLGLIIIGFFLVAGGVYSILYRRVE